MKTSIVIIDGAEFEFIPSHDEQGHAVPERWEHEDGGTFYSEEECRQFIKDCD
jgi:hypothetical protein